MLRIHLYAIATLLVGVIGAEAAKPNYQLLLDGQKVQGTPLISSSSEVLLLSRDGSYKQFKLVDAEKYTRLPGTFRSYSQSEVRGQLIREFGRAYDVSGTGNYLVVHPKGKRDLWAPRFEKLYRSFQLYFGSRGIRLNRLTFPLIAIVFPRKEDFLRYARQQGAEITSTTLGYYSPQTNRIMLYDVTADRSHVPWHYNADTIIHETAHQVAFNTGLHTRGGATPRWLAEGLGTMFEAPGVWDARKHPKFEQRLNKERLKAFQKYMPRRPKGYLASFVTSDRPFSQNANDAYAEAWALTLFLVETKPQQYMRYLQATSGRPAFRPYRQPERLSDFTACFGNNIEILETHYLRFMERL